MSMIQELRKRIKSELANGLPFMEGRENGSIVCGTELTISEFGFLTDHEKGEEYAVFLLKEDNEHFYFGGGVVTEKLQTIKEMLSQEELEILKQEGLQVRFEKKKSKDKNREYTDMEVL